MRIALVGDYPPPYGGVSVHVATLEGALRSRRVDVRVLDVGKGDHEGPGIAPARDPRRFAAELVRAALERRLLHVHTSGANPKSWMLALAVSRARLPGSPLPLLTLHSGLLPGYLAARPARRRMARAVCSGFGRVLAVSGEVAAALEAAGVPGARLSVQPAFLSGDLTPGKPPACFDRFRESCAPVFCAAIAPTPTYGEDLLLEAFGAVRRRLPRAGLALFGAGSDRGAMAKASACRVEGVLGLGEIEHRAALGVMAACDVFVRPTRAEGDALSVREALSLGRRVVASAVGQRPPGCLLFRAGDPAGLAERMLEAASLPAARVGHPAVPGDPFRALLDIYRSLARGRPSPSDSADRGEAPCSSR